MAVIDQDGLFKGKRLRKCSAVARWRFPYLLLLSNGYARIELDYESIADEFSSFRESAPTADELRETFADYRANHLLFVYAVNDQEWGQWDTRRTWLKEYKTTADNASPKPPEMGYQEWLRERHGEDWREFHWSKEAIEEMLNQSLPKPLPNLAQNFPAECYGVGVGVGEGKILSSARADANGSYPHAKLIYKIWQFYLAESGMSPVRTQLTRQRRQLIQRWLEYFLKNQSDTQGLPEKAADRVMAVIQGTCRDPFVSQNKSWLTIESVLGSQGKIDKGLARYEQQERQRQC
jgi:hypothetical protein